MKSLKKFNTLTKAMQSNTPSLGTLVRSMGDHKIEAYIKLWLINLNENLDLKKPLTSVQIDKIAFRIVENYRSLNIADINLIFKQAELGDYGETYDRISVPTVLRWFKDYFNSRCDMAAELSYQKHAQHKSAFSGVARTSETRAVEEHAKALEMYKIKQGVKKTD